jgi:hypothetical protein
MAQLGTNPMHSFAREFSVSIYSSTYNGYITFCLGVRINCHYGVKQMQRIFVEQMRVVIFSRAYLEARNMLF